MKKIVIVFFVILLGVVAYPLIIGFSFPIEKMPKSFVITAIVDNNESELCVIFKGDARYQKVSEIILNNKAGWGVDINSYTPVLKMQSDSINIIILNSWIVNFEHDYLGWIQLSKEIESNLNEENICA